MYMLVVFYSCFDWIGLALILSSKYTYIHGVAAATNILLSPWMLLLLFFSILKYFLVHLLLHYSLLYVRSWWDVRQFVGRFHFIEFRLFVRPYFSLRIFKTSTTSCSLNFFVVALVLPRLVAAIATVRSFVLSLSFYSSYSYYILCVRDHAFVLFSM